MALQVSVIVPTLNEAENLPLPHLAKTLAGRSYEVLVVDDKSPDEPPRSASAWR
jgi:glycosyltransferase involved in cell wall biosynthesis